VLDDLLQRREDGSDLTSAERRVMPWQSLPAFWRMGSINICWRYSAR
jgi:hypothetical protein